MRVILVGDARDRDRVRAQLDGAFEIVRESTTLAGANAAGLDVDALLVAIPHDIEQDGDDGRIDEEPLTPREVQVLELLAEGLPNKGIAVRLGISDQTVKFHVAAIAGKLGAMNRTDTVRRAIRRGLVSV